MASQTFRRLEIEGLLKGSFLILSLMSAGGKGLEERRRIEGRLKGMSIIAIIAEDDLPKDVASSLVEEHALKSGEVENVIFFQPVRIEGLKRFIEQAYKAFKMEPE